MQLFYTPDIQPGATAFFLSEEESKHCVRVLRLQQGDAVKLIDGVGNFYEAIITDPHPKRTILKIVNIKPDPNTRNHYLHIAIAPTKNIERLEWFLEKATEIGIDEVSLIVCHRSERKEVKVDRLSKIIVAAIKQSIKAYHPILNEIRSFNNFAGLPFDGQKFIAHCEPGTKVSLKESLKLNGRYMVMIGPEGDFSPAEIGESLHNGFKAITLGESRLRTETAALEACFEVNFLNR